MKSRTIVLFVLTGFVMLCGLVALETVRSKHPSPIPLAAVTPAENVEQPTDTAEPTPAVDEPAPESQLEAAAVVYPELEAVSGPQQTVTLGKLYPDAVQRSDDPDRYKFKVELTTLGAAVQSATLSEFDNRDPKDPQPLGLLSPLSNSRPVYSLAATSLRLAPADAEQFGDEAFPLDRLNWKQEASDDPDAAVFTAVLKDADTKIPTLKLIRTYRVHPGSYDLTCEITAENLTDTPYRMQMGCYGPVGLTREDPREDTRKIVVAYKTEKAIETRLLRALEIRGAEQEKIRPSQGIFSQVRNLFGKAVPPEEKLQLLLGGTRLPMMWMASTNKYFAAILRPVGQDLSTPGPVNFDRAAYIDAALMEREPAEHAGAVGLLQTDPLTLGAASESTGSLTLTFSLYLGPKDKSLFEANDAYRTLRYFQTIDFRGCCCPTSLIGPMAFGIMWLIKTVYTLMGPLGNYGVVIIFLVFIVRLILHPVTKHSQVSMMKMQKLSPRLQEIQKKYANNKQEMQRKTMELYREMGASPVTGMLPMFLQMPIWIALWTAVYTSVDLRGQSFLPFWITDLSAPDHLFKFPFGISIPYFGEYLNLLPLLMGGVMYAQQKLMPSSQAAVQTNPQAAQQQKMMMILMPLMFPLMLYHGPSGVNLYIMSSIGAGVIEQMVIRKHIRQREEMEAQGMVPVTAKTGGKLKKKKPKPMFKFDKS